MQNYNLIHEVKDISNGESGDAVGVLKSQFFDTTAGETSVTIDELENGTIIGLFRSNAPYEEGASPDNLVYQRTDTLFEFNTEFNSGEKIFIMWYEGSGPVEYDEPVTVDELKDYLRLQGFMDVDSSSSDIDFNDDDWLMEELITGARECLEEELWITIVPKVLKAIITNQAGEQTLPKGPINAILTFMDSDGDDLDYEMTGDDISSPKSCKMVITYAAGYANVPKRLKLAILKQCAWDFLHRGDENAGVCEDALKTARSFSKKSIML